MIDRFKYPIILLCIFAFFLGSCIDKTGNDSVVISHTATSNTAISFRSTITPNLERTATFEYVANLCDINGYIEFSGSEIREKGYSPNGEWTFIHCYKGIEDHSHYMFYNNYHREESWVVDFDEIVDHPWSWYPWGWSDDGQVLYLGFREFCELYECMYYSASALYKINPTDKSIISVLPLRSDNKKYAFNISNDSRSLAYVVADTNVLFIMDLLSGSETSIELNEDERIYGDLFFSPDGKYITLGSSSKEGIFYVSAWLVSMVDNSVEQLIPEEKRISSVKGWINDHTIVMFSTIQEPGKWVFFYYDIYSGALSIVMDPG